jgi:hypothetical protein
MPDADRQHDVSEHDAGCVNEDRRDYDILDDASLQKAQFERTDCRRTLPRLDLALLHRVGSRNRS